MLFLQFQIGDQRYALESAHIAAVLPWVDVRPLPQAAPGVAGVLDYRGSPVPVIDLSQLVLGRPAERRLSTRIVLVHYHVAVEESRLLGLIAEKATAMRHYEPGDFVATGVANPQAPYLGRVTATSEDGIVQRIEVEQLLPAGLRELLFREAARV